MRGRARIILAGGALALLGCSTGSSGGKGGGAAGGQAAAVVVDGPAAAKRAVGGRVRVEGTAGNAKISAAVTQGDLVVYCLDRPSWPDDRSGKPVTVEGTLEYTSEFQAQTSPTGEISQGTEGGVYVLRTCTTP